jgi:transcriptional regulator with XRE-family HTH domain
MTQKMKLEAQELVKKLLEVKRVEELAYLMGRSNQTIYRWEKGSIPSKGDYELMRRIFDSL